MRAIFSLSAVLLLAACGSFGTASDFKTEAPSRTLHLATDYERLTMCFMEQPNSGPIKFYGQRPEMEHYPGQRLARITVAQRSALGPMVWFSMVEIDGSKGDETEVRLYDSNEDNLAANVGVIEGCAATLS